jgi:hypothetical protein
MLKGIFTQSVNVEFVLVSVECDIKASIVVDKIAKTFEELLQRRRDLNGIVVEESAEVDVLLCEGSVFCGLEGCVLSLANADHV